MQLQDNLALVHCEGHAIKAFVTLMIRRHDGSKRREAFQH